MKLKNNTKDTLTCLETAFHLPVYIFFVLLYLFYNASFERFHFSLKSSILIYLILLIPAIYLLIEYHLKNKDQEIIITANNILLKSVKRNVEKSYLINNLEYIIFVKGKHLEDKIYIPFTLHDKFHFIKFVFKGGDEIFITSIMEFETNDIINMFDQNKVIRIYGVFASLNWSFASYVKKYYRSIELDEIFKNYRNKNRLET